MLIIRVRRFALLLVAMNPLSLVAGETFEEILVRSSPSLFDTTPTYDLPPEALPFSLDQIGSERIDADHPSRLESLIDQVPGALPGSLNAGLSTALTIRGFGVSRLRWNGIQDIQRLFVRDLHTVERIEVLRGPDAVLQGITSPGGTVRYVGKRPQFTPQHRLGLSVGDQGWMRATVDLTGPLSETVAYRLVSATQDGHTRPGHLTERRDHTVVNLTWRYHQDAALTLESEYQYNARPFLFGTIIDRARGEVMYDKLYASSDQRSARQYQRHAVYWQQAFGEHLDLAATYGQAKVQRDEALIGFWSVRNAQSLWGYYTAYEDRYRQSDLRLEAHARFSTLGLNHTLSLGHDDNRQYIDFTGKQNIAGFNIDIHHPDFSAVDIPGLAVTRRYNHEHLRERAWFIGWRSSFKDLAHLTLGWRENRYRIAADRVGSGLLPAAAGNIPTWQAGLSIRVVPQLHAYASVGTGAETNRGRTRDGDFVEPQQSRQTEFGLKWAAGKLNINSAIYRIRLENLTMRDPLDINALISTGVREVKGAELGGNASLGAWRLSAGANWLDSRNVSKTSLVQGEAFVNVPRFSANIRIANEHHFASGARLHTWLGAVSVGKRYGDVANSFKVASYRRYDLGAEWRQGRVTWSARVRNVADKRYVESISSASDVYQGGRRQAWLGFAYAM